MEEVLFRFSHLSEEIFDKLDNESLARCREVSKAWCTYLDGQRFLQIRKMEAKVDQFHAVGVQFLMNLNQ